MSQVLPLPVWQGRERAHAARIDAGTVGHRTRRDDGRKHPVEDFLFTYYSHKPSALRRWHPGAGVVLEGAAATDRVGWRFALVDGDRVTLDLDAFLIARGSTVAFVRELLARTAARKPHLGCFGLHEWAMVYRQDEAELRHADWPLRLGAAGTDAVVESQRVACTHFDAFRFFTGPARPLNTVLPTRDSQIELEQPGCLHAGMDVYKWAYKLTPAIASELVADCFDLARDIRLLDMRAAPYDLAALGVDPVPIETAAGRAAYVEAQRGFAERSQVLRAQLVGVCDLLLAHPGSADPRGAVTLSSSRRPEIPSRA